MPHSQPRNYARGEGHWKWNGGPDPARRRATAYASAARYPDRRRAREKVKDAIRAGKLPRAKTLTCFDCGELAASYDHFDGYDKALTVQPVCYRCHGRRSRERGEHKGIGKGIGKRVAGRLLDGKLWDQFPEASPWPAARWPPRWV